MCLHLNEWGSEKGDGGVLDETGGAEEETGKLTTREKWSQKTCKDRILKN
jgi:hypothetical protein